MKQLILAKDTEFEQNGKDLVLIDTEQRNGKPTMLNVSELNCSFINSGEDVKQDITIDELPTLEYMQIIDMIDNMFLEYTPEEIKAVEDYLDFYGKDVKLDGQII